MIDRLVDAGAPVHTCCRILGVSRQGYYRYAQAPDQLQRGVISMNKAAHELLDNADTVKLLFDRERQIMAIRVTDDSSPHAYAVRNGSNRGPGQAVVSATAFTAPYGIDTTATRRWKPFLEEGMLCVDLTNSGTVITGNRTMKLTPKTPEAPEDTPTDHPEATDG